MGGHAQGKRPVARGDQGGVVGHRHRRPQSMALAVPGRGQRPHGAGGQDLLVRGGCRADSLQQQPSRALAQVEGATTRSRAANWQGVSGVLADDRLRWLPDQPRPEGRQRYAWRHPHMDPDMVQVLRLIAAVTGCRMQEIRCAGGRSIWTRRTSCCPAPASRTSGAHVCNQRFDLAARIARQTGIRRGRVAPQRCTAAPPGVKASSGRWGRRGCCHLCGAALVRNRQSRPIDSIEHAGFNRPFLIPEDETTNTVLWLQWNKCALARPALHRANRRIRSKRCRRIERAYLPIGPTSRKLSFL